MVWQVRRPGCKLDRKHTMDKRQTRLNQIPDETPVKQETWHQTSQELWQTPYIPGQDKTQRNKANAQGRQNYRQQETRPKQQRPQQDRQVKGPQDQRQAHQRKSNKVWIGDLWLPQKSQIPLQDLSSSIAVLRVSGAPLQGGQITHWTVPVMLRMGVCHVETLLY